jgi:hypothetical protein
MQIGCLILVIGSLVVATVLMVATSALYGDVVHAVNIGKPPEHRIKEGDRTKILTVFREHADAFPASRKRLLLVGLGLSGIVCFLTFVVSAVMCFGSFT